MRHRVSVNGRSVRPPLCRRRTMRDLKWGVAMLGLPAPSGRVQGRFWSPTMRPLSLMRHVCDSASREFSGGSSRFSARLGIAYSRRNYLLAPCRSKGTISLFFRGPQSRDLFAEEELMKEIEARPEVAARRARFCGFFFAGKRRRQLCEPRPFSLSDTL